MEPRGGRASLALKTCLSTLQKLFYTVNNKCSAVGWSLLRKQIWKVSEGRDCPQHPKKAPALQEHPSPLMGGTTAVGDGEGGFRERLQGRDLRNDVCC